MFPIGSDLTKRIIFIRDPLLSRVPSVDTVLSRDEGSHLRHRAKKRQKEKIDEIILLPFCCCGWMFAGKKTWSRDIQRQWVKWLFGDVDIASQGHLQGFVSTTLAVAPVTRIKSLFNFCHHFLQEIHLH